MYVCCIAILFYFSLVVSHLGGCIIEKYYFPFAPIQLTAQKNNSIAKHNEEFKNSLA